MILRSLFLTLAIAAFCAPHPARATSTFARQYGFSCERCHTIVPALNTFGENFKSNGYRVAGMNAQHTIPLSTSVLATYESADAENDAKAIVDEWRLQSGGALGPAMTYYIEQYIIDGGAPGSLDQAWVQYDSNTAHPTAKTDVRVRAGRQYLPLPVYADTYRPTLNPYGIFDQTVGENGFALADEYTALDVAVGPDYDGTGVHLFVSGSNAELFAHQTLANVTFYAYRFTGRTSVEAATDAFWRQGFAAILSSKKLTWSTALQSGYDTNPSGTGVAQRSGGGFTELQWSLRSDVFAVARYDETFGDAGAQRALTSALVFRVSGNSRVTFEDVLQNGKHRLSSGVLLGF